MWSGHVVRKRVKACMSDSRVVLLCCTTPLFPPPTDEWTPLNLYCCWCNCVAQHFCCQWRVQLIFTFIGGYSVWYWEWDMTGLFWDGENGSITANNGHSMLKWTWLFHRVRESCSFRKSVYFIMIQKENKWYNPNFHHISSYSDSHIHISTMDQVYENKPKL